MSSMAAWKPSRRCALAVCEQGFPDTLFKETTTLEIKLALTSGTLKQELDEVDFCLQQRMYDDARRQRDASRPTGR